MKLCHKHRETTFTYRIKQIVMQEYVLEFVLPTRTMPILHCAPNRNGDNWAVCSTKRRFDYNSCVIGKLYKWRHAIIDPLRNDNCNNLWDTRRVGAPIWANGCKNRNYLLNPLKRGRNTQLLRRSEQLWGGKDVSLESVSCVSLESVSCVSLVIR